MENSTKDTNKVVIIEIQNGIPEVVKCPDGMELHIYDFDISGADEDSLCYCKEHTTEPHIHHIY